VLAMAGVWVLTVLALSAQGSLAAVNDDIITEDGTPYYDDVQLIKVHMPLPWWERQRRPCPSEDWAPEVTTGSPTTAASTESAQWHTTTAYPPGDIVIPDAASVDVIFMDGTRLNDSVSVFAFGGVFEVRVTPSRRAVDVTFSRLDELEGDEADESLPDDQPQPFALVIHGPSVTGIDSDETNAIDTEEDDWLKGAGDDDFSRLEASSWREQGSRRYPHRHHHHRARPIYINGSALSGNQLCGIDFNTTGPFVLNRTMTERSTTVIISLLNSTDQGILYDDGLLAAVREGMAGSAVISGLTVPTVLAVLAMAAALIVLVAAIVVWRARVRASRSSFVQVEPGAGYGTIDRSPGHWDFRGNTTLP